MSWLLLSPWSGNTPDLSFLAETYVIQLNGRELDRTCEEISDLVNHDWYLTITSPFRSTLAADWFFSLQLSGARPGRGTREAGKLLVTDPGSRAEGGNALASSSAGQKVVRWQVVRPSRLSVPQGGPLEPRRSVAFSYIPDHAPARDFCVEST